MGVSLSQLAIRVRLLGTSFDRCVPSRTVKSSSTATYSLDYFRGDNSLQGEGKGVGKKRTIFWKNERYSGKNEQYSGKNERYSEELTSCAKDFEGKS